MTTPSAQEPQPKPYPPAQQSVGEDRFVEPTGYVGEQEFPAYPPARQSNTELVPEQQAAPQPLAEQERQGPDWGRWRAILLPFIAVLAFVLFMATRQWWWWMLLPLAGVLFSQLPGGSRRRHDR
ncbi:MAG: hypothetical protein L0G99_09480 [Propionibacteriales bacterium]|nr:hypothetical protein [Propionibacteriales bacterium]